MAARFRLAKRPGQTFARRNNRAVCQSALTVRICMAGCAGAMSDESIPTNSACAASDIQLGAEGWMIASVTNAITTSTGSAKRTMFQSRSTFSCCSRDRSNEPCMDISSVKISTPRELAHDSPIECNVLHIRSYKTHEICLDGACPRATRLRFAAPLRPTPGAARYQERRWPHVLGEPNYALPRPAVAC